MSATNTLTHRLNAAFVLGALRPVLLSAALALGLSWSAPAIAEANNDSWDIGEYDSCIKMPYDKIDVLTSDYVEHIRYCCHKSGGIWTGRKCVAPPASPPQSTSSVPKPGLKLPLQKIEEKVR